MFCVSTFSRCVVPSALRSLFSRVVSYRLRNMQILACVCIASSALVIEDESLTELWLERLAAQKAANVDLRLSITGDNFANFPFKPFSAAYVKKALAEGVDWRTKSGGAVTPVKSQGSHGVCGTFGQTQTAESQYYLGGGGANPAKKKQQTHAILRATSAILQVPKSGDLKLQWHHTW